MYFFLFWIASGRLALSSATTWTPDQAGPCLTLIFFGFLSDLFWISSKNLSYFFLKVLDCVSWAGPSATTWASDRAGPCLSLLGRLNIIIPPWTGFYLAQRRLRNTLGGGKSMTLRMSNSECKDVRRMPFLRFRATVVTYRKVPLMHPGR